MTSQSNTQQNYQEHIKLVCVGDGTVGKTCLLLQFAQNSYNEDYLPTIFDNNTTTIVSNYDRKKYNLGLWDTSGQADYSRIRPVSYQGANVFLICFSISSPQSYQNVLEWKKEISHYVSESDLKEKIAILLVATKEDLRNDETIKQKLEAQGQHIITMNEIQKLAKEIGADNYIACSAKENYNVEEVFQLAVQCVLEKRQKKKKTICKTN